MVEDWLHPLKIVESHLTGIELNVFHRVPDDAPSLRMSARMRYEAGDECRCDLTLLLEYECGHEGETWVIDCDWLMSVSIPRGSFAEDATDERVRRFVEANAVALAYNEIRGLVEEVTSRSVIGRVTIPCVDPYRLRDALRSDEDRR